MIRNEAETSNVYLHRKAEKLGLDIEDINNRDKIVITDAGLYIINLAPSYEDSGTHWTGLYIDQRNRWALYYDSLGVIPPTDIIDAVNNYEPGIPLYYNTQQVQGFTQGYCGQHVIYFGYFVEKKDRTKNPEKIMKKFLLQFNATDTTKNDNLVRSYLKKAGFYNT